MRITKRQLKRIIKEEKARLREYGDQQQQSAADRAIGMFFDVKMMEAFSNLIDDMYENAWTAAMDETGDTEDAERLVRAGMQKLFDEELSNRR